MAHENVGLLIGGRCRSIEYGGGGIGVVSSERANKARSTRDLDFATSRPIRWPIKCTIGKGLQDAVVCETEIGYVNGALGKLSYRGYDIFDLCEHSSFEETSYLIVNGKRPAKDELEQYSKTLAALRQLPKTLRALGAFPIEQMAPMAALRVGVTTLRQMAIDIDGQSPDQSFLTDTDADIQPDVASAGDEEHELDEELLTSAILGRHDAYRLIAGISTIVAAIARLRQGKLPIEPDPDLNHAENLLYMITGEIPDEQSARIMDIALILHADHGMNASTFASMVVASTLSDLYSSVESGIAALSGPLHGGANEQALYMLESIGHPDQVEEWFKDARARGIKIMGFGHRVYKSYDPRAKILKPLAKAITQRDPELSQLYETAEALEEVVVAELGAEKNVFPNVDLYSGLIYKALGIEPAMFTPLFAASRVVGWVARCLEYVQDNRIFRPRAVYIGDVDQPYIPIDKRSQREA